MTMYKGQNKKNKKKWFEDQSVGEVSHRNGRGKHTTRNVTLLPLCGGGYLADTPGFNKHKLLKVTKQKLPLCFPEIRKMVEGGKCKYKDCSHLGVQGCAVTGGWERYDYFLQLLDEIKIDEECQLKKYGTKREGGVRYFSILLKQTAFILRFGTNLE
ncbi:putative ribosome biogenesis GTPase RsgA, P-loop containing nucleoside triphosphate hydrolase [Arabidopsis thaliana]